MATATAAERQRKHRAEKRARGECAYAGCIAKTGGPYYCAEHAAVRPRTLAVSHSIHDRLVKAADARGVTLAVLTEGLLDNGLKGLKRAA